MSLIPAQFIAELTLRTDIVELIGARVRLKKAGHNYQACCPFHEEKTPSFSVNPQKQFYYCFGCGAGGDAIKFLMAYEKLEFPEAVEKLADMLAMEIPRTPQDKNTQKNKTDLYAPLEKTSQYYQQQLHQFPKALAYLRSRNLTPEIIKKYHIGYSPDNQDYHQTRDAFRGRIIFPIHDRRGRVIGFGGRVLEEGRMPKYLNSADSPIFHKSAVLYGLYQAREANRTLEKILVVEGYMDVVSLAQAGINFAVATLGTATTPQHISQLLQQTSDIIFCFDGDNAGRKAAWRALESALLVLQDDTQIRFLFLPDGEDPDSLVKKEGKENFLARFEQSQSLGDFFFAHLKAQVSHSHTLEGRAKLASLARPYLENIPALLFREMMLDKLADTVRLEKSRLQVSPQKAFSSRTMPAIKRTNMRVAIALLLQNPGLGFSLSKTDLEEITQNSFFEKVEGMDLFKKIMTACHENPQWKTANLLAFFQDTSESQLLYKLAMWEHGVPEEGMLSEWQDILAAFRKKQQDNQIESLLQKSSLNLLTAEEKLKLQQLLSEK